MLAYFWGVCAIKFKNRERHRSFVVMMIVVVTVGVNLVLSPEWYKEGWVFIGSAAVVFVVMSVVTLSLALYVSLRRDNGASVDATERIIVA